MKIKVDRLFQFLLDRVVTQREPDFVIGADSPGGPYLLRWFLTPWRRWQSRMRKRAEQAPTRWNRFVAKVGGWLPNLYLHCFLRDDDDRAHHDHPSMALSAILFTGYVEHTIAAGGIHHRREYNPGAVRFLGLHHAHRIELKRDAAGKPIQCWSLFMFGPMLREWSFHCKNGWVHWKKFTAADNAGEVGAGCDA